MSEPEKSNNSETEERGFFRRIWQGWKRIARKIGDFNARVILTLFYFILLFPFAMLVKLFTDPLEIKKKDHIGWRNREDETELSILEKAEKQS